MMDRLISQAEAAEILGVSIRFLQRLRSGGEGPRIIRLGSRVKYRERDLEGWLASQFPAVKRDDKGGPVPNGQMLDR